METTKVIFRMWSGEVIALFPEIPAESLSWYNCLSYIHMGQHSAASPHHVIHNSDLATQEEYSDLKEELEQIGYNLIVCKRLTSDMTRTREETWREEVS